MKVTKKSIMTGKTHTLEIDCTQAQIDAWMGSTDLTQDAFPQLSADDKKFLMTGSTPAEWADAFPEEPEEPDEPLLMGVLKAGWVSPSTPWQDQGGAQ